MFGGPLFLSQPPIPLGGYRFCWALSSCINLFCMNVFHLVKLVSIRLIALVNAVTGSGAGSTMWMVLGLVSAFEVDSLKEPKESTLAESMFSSILLAQSCVDSQH